MATLFDFLSAASHLGLQMILNGAWVGLALTGAVWLMMKYMRNFPAAGRYLIWWGTLIVVLTLPLLALIPCENLLVVDTHSAGTTQTSHRLAASERSAAESPAVVQAPRRRFTKTAAAPTTEPEVSEPVEILATIETAPAVVLPWLPLALAVMWTICAGLLLYRLARAYRGLTQLKSSSEPFDLTDFPDLIASLEQSDRRRIRVAISDSITTPIAAGFFRPMIVLPRLVAEQLSDHDLDVIIRHELTHLNRRDDWSKLAQKLVEALFFFHPAVHLIGRQLELERELACDEAVVIDRVPVDHYAHCLTRLAQLTTGGVTTLIPGALTGRKQIFRRFERLLLNLPDGPSRKRSGLRAALLTGSIVLFGVLTAQVAPAVSLPFAPIKYSEVVTVETDEAREAAPTVDASAAVAERFEKRERSSASTTSSATAIDASRAARAAAVAAAAGSHVASLSNDDYDDYGDLDSDDYYWYGDDDPDMDRSYRSGSHRRTVVVSDDDGEESWISEYVGNRRVTDRDTIAGEWRMRPKRGGTRFEMRMETYEGDYDIGFSLELDHVKGIDESDFQRDKHDVRFVLERDPGTVVFKGTVDSRRGSGEFWFEPNKEFVKELTSRGVRSRNVDDEGLFGLALHDVSLEYVDEMISLGLDDLTLQGIVSLSIHDVDPQYLADFKKLGLNDLTVDELVQFAIHEVDPFYVQDYKELGYTDLTPDELVQLSIHDVDPDFIRSIHELGLNDIPFDNLIQFAIHDVEPSYIASVRDLGYRDITPEELVQLSIHDVDVDLIQEIHEQGLDDIDIDELVQFSIHDIDPSLIESYSKGSHPEFDAQDLVQMSIHDIDADYIDELAELGLTDIPVDELIQLKIHDVSPRYIREFRDLGYKRLDTEDLIQLAIQDVTPRYVRQLAELGYDDLDPEDIIRMRIHGVTASYIRRLKSRGYDDLSADEVVEMRIRGKR